MVLVGKNNLLSVIITAHNEENYIVRAIESIFKQTFEDLEIIVVDDGSTDSTLDLTKKTLNEKRNAKIIRNEKTLGLMQARNVGVYNSNGKYIAFLDADDEWAETKAESQIKNLLDEDGMLFTGRVIYDTKGNPHIYNKKSIQGKIEYLNYMQILAKSSNLPLGASMMLSRKNFEMIGGFDTKVGKERDLIARYSISGGLIKWLGLPLYIQHRKPGSMSTNTIMTFKREVKMLDAWNPNKSQNILRKISIDEFNLYEKHIYFLYAKEFYENKIELPTQLKSFFLENKTKIKLIVLLRRYKRIAKQIYSLLYFYYNKFTKRI